MTLIGVAITGTSGSGKTSVAKRLAELHPSFEVARALTTRKRRASDEACDYRHVTIEKFEELRATLIVSTSYRGDFYGIEEGELERICRKNRVPVLVVSPECLKTCQLLALPRGPSDPAPGFLTLFIDAPNEILGRRLSARDGSVDQKWLEEQADADRLFGARALYKPTNGSIDEIAELIRFTWEARGQVGIIAAGAIEMLVKRGVLLEDCDLTRIQGASYDLSLGDEYYYGGRIHKLSNDSPFLLIEPYDYAIVTSHEMPNLPANVAARFDLSVGLFCQGLILSNGPQVDPGFRGPLFCLLFNTSSSAVLLKRRQHYATLEFHQLSVPTFPYRGTYQGKELLHYLPPTAAQGAISDLKRELEEVRKESRRLQELTWAILSLIIALLALFLALS